MSNGYSNRLFQCPFFKWDELQKLHCEAAVVTIPARELQQYMDRYCASLPGWKTCPLASALLHHYDLEEELYLKHPELCGKLGAKKVGDPFDDGADETPAGLGEIEQTAPY